MPSVKVATKSVPEDMSGVEINFSDGSAAVVNLNDFDETIIRQLALHGLSQKLGDSYAGKDVTVEFAKAKVDGVVKRLKEGNWKAVREAGSGGRITDLVNAVAAITGREVSEVVEMIDGMDKEAKKDLRAHAQVKAKLAEIAAERARLAAEKAAGEADEGGDLGSLFG